MIQEIVEPNERKSCTLCQTKINNSLSFIDNGHYFCCHGCQTVFQILSAQNIQENFREHPVFKQALKSGILSNPDLLDACSSDIIRDPLDDNTKIHLEIQNMWCPSCALVIKLILKREKGILNCIVDYATDLAIVEFSPKEISKERILRLIKSIGYEPQFLSDPRQQLFSQALSLRFIIALFFSLNVMMFSYPIYSNYFHSSTDGYAELFAWLSLIGSIPVLTYSAWPIWKRLYQGLLVGVWGMELLVCLGVLAATGLSLYELSNGSPYVYFDSMTVIIVFVLLGKIIETKAKFSAKDALVSLVRAMPRRGRKRFAPGDERFVPLKDIGIADEWVVFTGEKLVLDGVVVEGKGVCDESLMTGESCPVEKKIGDKVLAGSLLQHGSMVIKATSTAEETALFKIIEMVEQDIQHKTQYTRAIDSIVKWFVPLMFTVAFLSFGYGWGIEGISFHEALIRAVSVLLISCPCAIGIAAPLAEAQLLNVLAKMGAIVRNRGCLQFLGRETAFVFDKTGTMTEGKFKLLKGLEMLSFEQQRRLKGLVSKSTHPISLALNKVLLVPEFPFESIEEFAGKGLSGRTEGIFWRVGSLQFLLSEGVKLSEEDAPIDNLVTSVYFSEGEKYLSTLHLGDQLRSESIELIQSLPKNESYLLSGDSEKIVKLIAEKCQFSEWSGECLPLQKRDFVNSLKLKGKIVLMMGDGINDAAALAAAHVGIAVVSATDISIQVSDIMLTTERLETVKWIRYYAQRGRKIIRQNLFWAFFYNVVGIPLAAVGLLTPLFAAFAMVMSSLFVLFNTQRLSKKKPGEG